MLKAYAEFEIDEGTGEALNIHNRIDLHYNRVLALQVFISSYLVVVVVVLIMILGLWR